MTSKDYWAKRSALDMARYMRTAEQTAALMEQTGKAAADYINSLIKGVFTGFEGFGISETEARNILSAGNNRTALQRLRAAASRVTDPNKRQDLTDAINSAGAYRYRIDRLEEVGRQITEQCNSLYQTQLGAVRSCLGGVASEAYYRSIFNIQQRTGLGFSFALFPKSQVEQLLSKHWCGASYSQRLWKDTDILADGLKDELLIGLLSGRSGEKTARVIREQFGNNAYCARRLVRTESSYISGQAAMQGYDEAGIEKYIFLATLREATCDICAELDGQRFSRSEAKPGENMNPMHPNCACTTIADISPEELHKMERRAKDKNGNTITVPADMTYKQWREKFVEKSGENQNPHNNDDTKKPVDNYSKNVIINTGVLPEEQIEFKPAETIEDAKEYAKNILGFDYAQYEKFSLEAANMVNEEITKVYNVFGNIHKGGYLDGIFHNTERNKEWTAFYQKNFHTITLRGVSGKKALERLAEDAGRHYSLGFYSTQSAEHSIRHELGHAVGHWLTDNSPEKFSNISKLMSETAEKCGLKKWSKELTPENMEMMKKSGQLISHYALYNEQEFMAEAIAEYMDGNPRETASKVVEILLRKE